MCLADVFGAVISLQEGCGNLHENGLSAGSAHGDGKGQVESSAI